MPTIAQSSITLSTPTLSASNVDATAFSAPSQSIIPIVAALPSEDIIATTTASVYAAQTNGIPAQMGWQWTATAPAAPSQAAMIASTLSANKITGTGIPNQVGNVYASESPYKLRDNTLCSLVAVEYVPAAGDHNFSKVQIWFTGYSTCPTPQLMAEGSESPVSFLCDTTYQTVTVTVVAVGPSGLSAPFAGAPTCTVDLNGVVTAPPPPSIAEMRTALPGDVGWEFSFNVVNGLEADVIDGYWLYRSTSSTTPVPPLCRWKYIKQPTTNIGIQTEQDYTTALYYYWVSSSSTSGLESSLQSVGVTEFVVSEYPTGNATAYPTGLYPVGVSTINVKIYAWAGANNGINGRTPANISIPAYTWTGQSVIFNCQNSNAKPMVNNGVDGAGNYYPDKDFPLYPLGASGFSSFDMIVTGSFVVNTAGNISWSVSSDDGFWLAIGGGVSATPQGSTAYLNLGPQGGTGSPSPMQGLPILAAYNRPENMYVQHSYLMNFPSPGVYPFEIGYAQLDGGLTFMMYYDTGADDGTGNGTDILAYPCNGALFINGASAYDGNETTSCSVDDTLAYPTGQTFIGFSNPPSGLTRVATTLKVMSYVSGSGTGTVNYSLNNGASWTAVYSTTSHAQAYDAVTLPATQDLTQVQVQGIANNVVMNVYECRIECTVQ